MRPRVTRPRSAKCLALARASFTASSRSWTAKGASSSTVKLILFIRVASPPAVATSSEAQDEVTVEQLKPRLERQDAFLLLDVREPQEFQICRIPGSVLIPLGDLSSRLSEVEGRDDIVVHCKSGVRSGKAVKLLREAGYSKARNLKGGILAWINRIDPTLPKY